MTQAEGVDFLAAAAAGPASVTLSDLRLRPAVSVGPSVSIAECAELMAREQVSCLPVMGEAGLVGILTDRDLRTRVLARHIDPGRPIDEVMTRDPLSVAGDARIEDALVEMMRLGIHHLPVLAEDGRLVGVVSGGDLLRLQVPHPLRLVRDIQRAVDLRELVTLARQGPGVLAALTDQDSSVTAVGRIGSLITDACTRRLIALAQAELGAAPLAWAWLAFGSQARMEQGLISDQDNGLLLAEAPGEAAAAYFRQLAEFVCDGLDACGYAHCGGGVMAKGRWRMPIEAWRRTFEGWICEPTPESVLNSSIFFDMRGVAGDLSLAQRLHGEVLERARGSRIFLRFLAAEALRHTPPLGLFRRFVQERDGGQGHGMNLKKRGVLPIVDLARVRALEGGLADVHTETRFKTAARAGVMSDQDAEDLTHAYRFIGTVRLRHQVRMFERGKAPDHRVPPEELSGLHRRYLRSAFRTVRSAQRALALRYSL
jgi:CBS domain-containing protein